MTTAGDGFAKTNGQAARISVVTVCRNAEAHIAQAITSVLAQTYPEIEYIIVDGASTDATLAIISEYQGRLARVISEPDSGIAEAMNKGLALASGDYVMFLHADDYFADAGVIQLVAEQLDAGDELLICDIRYGNALRRLTPRGLGPWMRVKTGVFHQGSLTRRDLLLKLNGFDMQFRIAMDYDFFLRAYDSGVTAKYLPICLAVMRDTGVSGRKDWPGLVQRFREEYAVHRKNSRSLFMRAGYWLYWAGYAPYRTLRFLAAAAIPSHTNASPSKH